MTPRALPTYSLSTSRLTRDPITQRMICKLCWNQHHDECFEEGCKCMHWDSAEAADIKPASDSEDSEDSEDEE